MTDVPLLPVLLVIVAGAAVATQSPLNAALGRGIGSGLAAGAISFGVGFLALLIVTVLFGQGSSLLAIGKVPSGLLVGGVLGAFFVWAMLSSVPVLGVVTATAALILGQMSAALVLDMIGAFGLPKQPITWTRVGAVALVIAGLVLSRV